MRSIFCIIIISFCLNTAAQLKSEEKTFFVEGSVGAASPSGYFNSNDPDNLLSGFAQIGTDFNINGGFQIIKTFGVMIKYNMSLNPVNKTTINDYYTSEMQDYLDKNDPGYTINSTNTKSGWYWSNSGMGGIYVTIPVDRISIDVRTLAGYLLMVKPELNYSASLNTDDQYTIKEEKKNGGGIAYNVGFSVNYMYNPNFIIFGNIGYLKAEPKIMDIQSTRTVTSVGQSNSYHKYWDPRIEIFNFSFGLRYTFTINNNLIRTKILR
jgi:hypothetical protein